MSSVGIYMPAYNVDRYIEQSIMSVKNQTFKNWELVILDDCSIDETHIKAKNYFTTNIRVFKRSKHSGKIGQIKNEAMGKFAEPHEYICHVGSDDLIPPHCLKTFVDYMDEHPEVGACCGNFICFDDFGKQWSFPHVTNSGEFDPKILLKYMNFFPHRFYRRGIVEKVGGYNSDLSSAVDYDLILRISELPEIQLHRIKESITYYYRQHPQQVSTKARPEQDLNAKHALENALKRRGINGIIINDAPPFIIEEQKEQQFIWGKK